jgi:pimeloyl-ACP methyl ester carboxylesterase/DNA-binding CsgD family transcriptional regulator
MVAGAARDMRAPKQRIRFCESRDGTRIAYATSGEGPPLVLAANWLTHLEYQWRNLSWDPLLTALSERYTVVRYDPRGCGLSDWNANEISFDAWLSDFEAVVEAAGLERFPILGVCQGGAIAIEYATRHPEQVSRLMLFGALVRGRLKRNSQQEMEIAKLRYDMTRVGWAMETHAFLQAFASLWQPGGTTEHLRSWCELQKVTTSAEIAVRHLQLADNIDVSSSANRVRCPTLVVHADRDRVIPVEEARRCAALIPHATFVQLQSENHLLLDDEPAWPMFLEELEGFIPSQTPARAREPFSGLSKREADVLELMAQGRDNSQIAASLDLSEKTVRNHVSGIFAKLGVENRGQAIVLARDAGFGK